MSGIERRVVMRQATGWGILAGLVSSASVSAAQDEVATTDPASADDETTRTAVQSTNRKIDRKCVLKAGMTEAEADC